MTERQPTPRNVPAFPGAAEILRGSAAWGAVLLAAVLPFRKHFDSLREIFLLAPFMLLLAAVVVGRMRGARERLRFGPLAVPVLLIGATALWAASWSLAPEFSFEELRKQFLKFAVAWFCAWNLFNTPAWRRRAFWAFFAGGAAGALYGVVAYYGGLAVESGRALGPLWSYSRSAMLYVLWMPLVFTALLRKGCPRGERIALAAGLVLAWWFLALTGTRGAVAAAGGALLALAALKRLRWALILLAVAALTTAAVGPLRERAAQSLRDFSNFNQFSSGRLTIWSLGWEAARENLWTGVGYGSDIFQEESVQEHYRLYNYAFQPDAHQFFIQILAEGGVPHLFAFVAFFGVFFFTAGRALRRAGPEASPADRALVSGVVAGAAALLVYGLVGHFHETQVAMTLWWLLGLALAAAEALRTEDA